MLSELFQLDEPPQDDDDDGGSSLRAGGSEDSYSDDDREEDVEAELSDASDESDSYRKQDDSKAVAVIRSVGELSIPEKYTSTHHIRVSATLACRKKSQLLSLGIRREGPQWRKTRYYNYINCIMWIIKFVFVL